MTEERLPGPLTVYRRRAMASDFEISFNDRGYEGGEGDEFEASAALDALDEIDRIEDALSIFRPTSALSRVNLLASEMNVRVDDALWDWIQTSLRLGEETEFAFDITSTPLWRAWGFARRDGEFPSEEALARARELVGAARLRLDEDARTIAFDREGVELNFGAIGKGIALDVAAEVLLDRGVGDFLAQGGKSGAVARGGRRDDYPPTSKFGVSRLPDADSERASEEYDEESGLPIRARLVDAPHEIERDSRDGLQGEFDGRTGWTIGVAHPLAPERRLGEIWLKDRALATSGSTYQFFRSGGKRYSHVVDPRTGYPTVGVLQTTVLAPTATEADALSTAFFVLGVEKSRAICERRGNVSALFALEKATYPGYELVEINLSSDVWRPNVDPR